MKKSLKVLCFVLPAIVALLNMKKSLKVLCFVLPAIVALLIIAAIVISQFTDNGLINTIESAGTKALNVGAWIFNKIVDFIIFCGRPIWNVYIKNIFNKVAPLFITGFHGYILNCLGKICCNTDP